MRLVVLIVLAALLGGCTSASDFQFTNRLFTIHRKSGCSETNTRKAPRPPIVIPATKPDELEDVEGPTEPIAGL